MCSQADDPSMHTMNGRPMSDLLADVPPQTDYKPLSPAALAGTRAALYGDTPPTFDTDAERAEYQEAFDGTVADMADPEDDNGPDCEEAWAEEWAEFLEHQRSLGA